MSPPDPSHDAPSPIPSPERVPERGFDEPWQARAFALAVALNERGAFGWDEWAATLSVTIADDPGRPYWLQWLAALERIAVARGPSDADAIAATARAWREAADRTPHGKPVVLDRPNGSATVG